MFLYPSLRHLCTFFVPLPTRISQTELSKASLCMDKNHTEYRQIPREHRAHYNNSRRARQSVGPPSCMPAEQESSAGEEGGRGGDQPAQAGQGQGGPHQHCAQGAHFFFPPKLHVESAACMRLSAQFICILRKAWLIADESRQHISGRTVVIFSSGTVIEDVVLTCRHVFHSSRSPVAWQMLHLQPRRW